MKTRFAVLRICMMLMIFGSSAFLHAQNFIGADAEVRQVADRFRVDIAEFWTGEKFPNWSSPCRITVRQTGSTGGGATSFSFVDGQVFGFSMTVEGTRKAIIDDCIPHEVNHTILATITRRPLTRWLDEGVATLWESRQAHLRYFQAAYRNRHSPGQVFRVFDAPEYSQNISHVRIMYDTGYTLVEWILSRHDKDRLLEFIKDDRKPSQKFREYFGVTPQVAEQQWLRWLEANYRNPVTYFGYRYKARKVNSSLPTMHVATAKWCGPCRQFWFDMRTDSGFREAVLARVNLVAVDSRLQSQWIQQHGVQSFPSFYLGGQVAFQGYGGGIKQRKHAFVNQLDSALQNSSVIPEVTIQQPQIDLGEAVSISTFDTESQIEKELAAAKERDTKLGSALAGLNRKLDELEESSAPPVEPSANSTPAAPGGAVFHQQGEPSKPIEKIKDVAVTGAKTYLSLKYGGALAAASAATGLIGWWFGKRIDKKGRDDPVAEWSVEKIAPLVQSANATRRYELKIEALEKQLKELTKQKEEPGQQCQAPFPRHLDEADQLRQLRQAEGRVAALDALVGMIFDDKVREIIETSESSEEKQYIRNLRDQIMDRVDQIAPIATPSKGE